MSRNMRKMRQKCVTAKIYPMKVRILQIIIFKVTLRTILVIFPQVWDHIFQNSFFEIFFVLFSILNSRMSKDMCIWRHKLCNSKTGVDPTFTWSNEPWYIVRCPWLWSASLWWMFWTVILILSGLQLYCVRVASSPSFQWHIGWDMWTLAMAATQTQ